MTLEHPQAVAGVQVPEPEGVVPAGGEQPAAIGGEGAGVDPALMTLEHPQAVAGVQVPEPEGVVPLAESSRRPSGEKAPEVTRP
jgi:hypothetical protein